MDERRPGGRLQVHELWQMPEIELHEELRWLRSDFIGRHDASFQLCLKVLLPRINLPHEPVEQDQVIRPSDIRHIDVRVLSEREQEVGGLRVHHELATHGLRGLEESTDAVDVAPRERDDRELLLERRQEADRVRLHVRLREAAPRVVRRDPRAFRDQHGGLRRFRRGDEILRQGLHRSVVAQIPRVRDRALARMHQVPVRRGSAVVHMDRLDLDPIDRLRLAGSERLVRMRS